MPLLKPTRSALMVLLILSTTVVLLSGCAQVMLLSSAATLANAAHGPAPDPSRERETNRHSFNHPPAEVYSALIGSVEKDGRKIVERDPDAHSLVVSYPFSWLHNNWGGVITITCTSNEAGDGKLETTVRVIGGARDANFRIRTLGDSILQELAVELRRSTDPGLRNESGASAPPVTPR